MSLSRLEEHRRIWESKPVLADVYGVWFEAVAERLSGRARILELGAGPGFLRSFARKRLPEARWLSSDVIEAGWNDLVADGLRLPFGPGVFDAVAAFDLVHHLARPAAFFREAARVLSRAGRIVVVEPWITPLSFPIYRFLHQERCRLDLDPWNPFESAGDRKGAFEGDAAVLWRLCRDTAPGEWARLGFRPPQVVVLNGFAYLLSLGFRRASLLPRPLAPLLLRLDRGTSALAGCVGVRALAVWDREDA